uniref:Uncharacterized protein n=1 Tax=Rhizophora mucronata TaxID=61149 RepID=A0A2P2R4M8_RHIMU
MHFPLNQENGVKEKSYIVARLGNTTILSRK